jgi:hypothetical protein
VLFDGAEFGGYSDGTSDDEQDYLGLPGLLDADQVAVLLRDRQARQIARGRRGRSTPTEPEPEVDVPIYEQVAALRRRLGTLVSAYAGRTGRPHAGVHAELRRQCGGPPTAQASLEQLEARIAALARLGG